jgi:hypothetical protein
VSQESLFDVTPGRPGAPRCAMCMHDARWNRVQNRYEAYCSGRSCASRDRLCRTCGAPFTLRVAGAGNIYCSDACKIAGYRPRSQGASVAPCAWCGAPNLHRSPGGTWPYICGTCVEPIRRVITRLKDHHVSHERARQLITDPYCEVCGMDVLTPMPVLRGRPRPLLVVDHDHACCPPPLPSCGRCVRGLICGGCNSAMGLLRDSAHTARSLADYLDRSVKVNR